MEWTGARYADQPTVEVHTWIDAPPERVWTLVSDVEAMPDMSTELQRIEWSGGATGPALGAAFVGHNRHPQVGDWSAPARIVEWDEPAAFGWEVGRAGDPAAYWRFVLEPADGGTRLRQWVRLGPGPSGLTPAIVAMPDKEQKIVHGRLCEFERNMTATLAAIKQRVEAG